jgi:hypothetical protein
MENAMNMQTNVNDAFGFIFDSGVIERSGPFQDPALPIKVNIYSDQERAGGGLTVT